MISRAGRRFISTMRAVTISKFGGPENLVISQDVPVPVPKQGEVLMRVKATALNRADLLQRRGMYPPPPGASNILGLEAAGVIETNSGTTYRWSSGDRVMALLGGGGYGELVAVDARHLLPVPSDMSFEDAACIPEAWLTAYQLLHTVGHLSPQDTVLIHAGASGVGTAAVQLVKLAGATSYVTAGSDAKLDLALGLGASAGFNYKTGDWSVALLEATNGKGVNLVLDCIGESYLDQNLKVLTVDGRLVVYGRMGGKSQSPEQDLFARLMAKRLCIAATTLRSRDDNYKAALVRDFEHRALPHFTQSLRPVKDTVFPLEQVKEAHLMMESNRNSGKIILTF